MGRTPIIIVGGGLALALLTAQAPPSNPVERTGVQQAQGSSADENEVRSLDNIARAIEGVRLLPPTEEEKKDARDDVQAQRDMAFWAVVIAVFTGLQVLIGALGTVFLLRTLDLAQASTALSQRLFEAENRPWIDLNLVVRDAVMSAKNLNVHFSIEQKNIGRTPAYGVTARGELVNATDPDVEAIIADFLDDEPLPVGADALLPGNTSFSSWQRCFWKFEWQAAAYEDVDPELEILVVVRCLYTWPGSGTHQTSKVFHLAFADGEDGPAIPTVVRGKVNLRLYETGLGRVT